jgi:hypothetical protein
MFSIYIIVDILMIEIGKSDQYRSQNNLHLESEGAELSDVQFELANKNQTKENFKHISCGARGKNVDMFIHVHWKLSLGLGSC